MGVRLRPTWKRVEQPLNPKAARAAFLSPSDAYSSAPAAIRGILTRVPTVLRSGPYRVYFHRKRPPSWCYSAGPMLKTIEILSSSGPARATDAQAIADSAARSDSIASVVMGGPKSDIRNRGAAGDGFLGEQSRAAAIQNKQSREAANRMLA